MTRPNGSFIVSGGDYRCLEDTFLSNRYDIRELARWASMITLAAVFSRLRQAIRRSLRTLIRRCNRCKIQQANRPLRDRCCVRDPLITTGFAQISVFVNHTFMRSILLSCTGSPEGVVKSLVYDRRRIDIHIQQACFIFDMDLFCQLL
jgi:hypothetical protein